MIEEGNKIQHFSGMWLKVHNLRYGGKNHYEEDYYIFDGEEINGDYSGVMHIGLTWRESDNL